MLPMTPEQTWGVIAPRSSKAKDAGTEVQTIKLWYSFNLIQIYMGLYLIFINLNPSGIIVRDELLKSIHHFENNSDPARNYFLWLGRKNGTLKGQFLILFDTLPRLFIIFYDFRNFENKYWSDQPADNSSSYYIRKSVNCSPALSDKIQSINQSRKFILTVFQ